LDADVAGEVLDCLMASVTAREKAMIRVRSITGLAAALTMLSAIYAFPGRAQDAPPSLPSASVNIHQVQIAFIGSGTAGGGTLYYRGRAYPFKLGGLGIGGFGVSRLDASGNVYNMRSPQDINGVYAQVRSGWAIGEQGRGRMWLKNSNGVYLKLHARRQGLALSLGADGMVLQLGS
jgi:hypothetical protein